ncbi:MAG: thiol:disulfide interchange protein DsbA/DsbL [Aquincola sp.]|nr:thiol:disulfide interchange protein DsbA/DsbL [Aquincola sp.]|tara:strand:- start:3991 stop:4629 length:639 start_codon:yes stop_codon:yes gene_type:complete
MHRRQFSKVAIVSAVACPVSLYAQERPVVGKHYVSVSPPQPTLDPKQVEVVEFFAYSCEHCFIFEPALDAWQKRLPSGVRFRRIPVAFREGPLVGHQKLFFAIEQLGLVDQLHGKVFTAIHIGKQRLDTPQGISDFATKNGVAPAKLLEAFNSFAVATQAAQAQSLWKGYKVEGTPSLGVDGRWLTSGSLAGSNERSLAVAEFLVGEAKRVR